jgi:serine/threonine protein phosphatase PrpC
MPPQAEPLASPLVISETDMVAAATYQMAGGEVVVFTTRSPGKPTSNEDSVALLPIDEHSAILVVADGVGGNAAGEQASRLAVTTLRRALLEGIQEGLQVRTMLMNGIERANEAVLQLGTGMATTLAAIEISPQAVRPYHVGDSLITVVGQRGRIKLETVSHSPVGYAVAAGVLDVQAAMHHADRHLVSNVIGTAEMHIEVGPNLPLSRFDTVLIASDGLSDNLHQTEIIERIRKGPLPAAMQRLVDDSHHRMLRPDGVAPSKPDDLTVILFRRLQ